MTTNDKILTGTGVLETVNAVPDKAPEQTWHRWVVNISGSVYSAFFNTTLPRGTEVSYTYTENLKGKTLQTITAKTASPPPAPAKEKKTRAAMDDFQHDLAVINARDKAMSHAVMLSSFSAFSSTESVIAEAEKIEEYLLRKTKQDTSQDKETLLQICAERIIERVVNAKKPVLCENIDKLFILEPEARERLYQRAEATKKVWREDGFWYGVTPNVAGVK